MSRNKSLFITLIIAAMLALILVGAQRIEEKVFFGILAGLAGYGFLRGAGDLCRWMQAKEPPVETIQGEEVKIDEDPFARDDDEFHEDGYDAFTGGFAAVFGGKRFQEGEFHGTQST